MSHRNNVNNVNFQSESNNVTMLANEDAKHRRAERIARRLVDKYSNPGAYKYYLTIAYKLSESTIEQANEMAANKRSSTNYFTWLSKLLKDGKAVIANGKVIMVDE